VGSAGGDESGGVGRLWEVSKRWERPALVVIIHRGGDPSAGMAEANEQTYVEKLVAAHSSSHRSRSASASKVR